MMDGSAGAKRGRGKKAPDNVRSFSDGGRGNKTADNVSGFKFGNSEPYTVARLKRDHKELAQQVIAGKLTANAAAIQAGFRVRTISVPLDPKRAGKILRRHFSLEQLQSMLIGE
jgi:hypothetical protein